MPSKKPQGLYGLDRSNPINRKFQIVFLPESKVVSGGVARRDLKSAYDLKHSGLSPKFELEPTSEGLTYRLNGVTDSGGLYLADSYPSLGFRPNNISFFCRVRKNRHVDSNGRGILFDLRVYQDIDHPIFYYENVTTSTFKFKVTTSGGISLSAPPGVIDLEKFHNIGLTVVDGNASLFLDGRKVASGSGYNFGTPPGKLLFYKPTNLASTLLPGDINVSFVGVSFDQDFTDAEAEEITRDPFALLKQVRTIPNNATYAALFSADGGGASIPNDIFYKTLLSGAGL